MIKGGRRNEDWGKKEEGGRRNAEEAGRRKAERGEEEEGLRFC